MGTATLNISLDEQVCAGASAERRYAIVRAALRLMFQGVVGEIRQVSYIGPDGPVQEACGVFVIEHDAQPAVLEDAVHRLSCTLGQDCIAVLYPNGEGKCAGPRAARWPFNPEFFHLPSGQMRAAA